MDRDEEQTRPWRPADVTLLRQIPLFAVMPAEQVQALAGVATWRSYYRGKTILSPGEGAAFLLWEAVSQDVSTRLRHELARRAEGDPEHMVWVTHKELGQRISASRETVTRLLQHLREDGLIDFEPHHVMGLIRQLGLIQMRLGIEPGVLITEEGLDRGVSAPDFEALDVQSKKMVRRSDYLGRRLALIFISPGCLACREIIPHVNSMARSEGENCRFLLVCHGILSSCEEFAHRYGVEPPMLVDPSNGIAAEFGISASPFAFLLDEEGTILIRGIVNSWPHLEALLKEEGTLQTHSAPWQTGDGRQVQIVELSDNVQRLAPSPKTGNIVDIGSIRE